MVGRLVAVDGFVSALRLPEKGVEVFIEAAHRLPLSAQQPGKPVRVVRHRPCGGLRRLLAVVAVRPVQRRTRLEQSVRPARQEASLLCAPVVAVVGRTGAEHLGFAVAPHRIRENRRRPVGISEILRARNGLARNVARDVSELHVGVEPSARLRRAPEHAAVAPFTYGVDMLRSRCIALYGGICGIQVESAKSLHVRFGKYDFSRRTRHDPGVGRIGPLGQPSAFALHVHERLHHTVHVFRRNKGQQRMLGAVGVPQRKTRVHFAVVDPVVKSGIVAPVLVDLAREEKRAVESGVEYLLDILRRVDLKTREHPLPLGLRRRNNIVERKLSDLLFEIRLRLLSGDER